MALTPPMVFTSAVTLILHICCVLALMIPIQALEAKFHTQILQMEIQ